MSLLPWKTAMASPMLKSAYPSGLPTAAQRTVKGDCIEQTGGLELQKILLRGVKILLRQQNIHIAVHALSIARAGDVETFLLGAQQDFLRFKLFIENRTDGQRIRHFPERGLNGFFVIGDLDSFADLRDGEFCPVATEVEN